MKTVLNEYPEHGLNALTGSLAALILASLCAHASSFDLSRDYSPTNNPNGSWTYGAAATLGGPLQVFTIHGTTPDDLGRPIEYWQLQPLVEPTIYRNGTTNVARAGGGQGMFPPGTVWLFSGTDGLPNGFGVVRFTVPAGVAGDYRVETAVRPVFDGSFQGDTDFHVLRNGMELFGRFLAPAQGAGYSNTLALAAGDWLEFVVGRGADGRGGGSGLKLVVQLTATTNTPPPPTNCVSAPTGLVAWWPFEGNGQDAFGTNDVTLFGGPAFVPGRVGQAIRFDGVNDSGRAVPSPDLDVGAGPGLTVEGWIRPESLVPLQPLVEWNSGGGIPLGAHFWLSVDTVSSGDGVGDLFANLTDTSGTAHIVRTPAGILTTGMWQHVGLTYDKASGQAVIYRNGVLAGQMNLGTFVPQTSFPVPRCFPWRKVV